MEQLREDELREIVENVIKRLKTKEDKSVTTDVVVSENGLFNDVKSGALASQKSQKEWISLPLEKRKKIISLIRQELRKHVETLAKLAVSETGLGRVDDKIKKNLLVIDKTPGIEFLHPSAYSGDDGLMLEERAPFGVIGAITPCTNASETVICNGIGMIAGGNGVLFNAHPSAKKSSILTCNIMNSVIASEGGPQNLLATLSEPTIETANQLMKNDAIALLVVTGGPQVVRVAMNSGKKVIAAGPGNPPVVVDETADLDRAGKSIVLGASLDNNIVCVVEKEIFAIDKIKEPLKLFLKKYGAVEVSQYDARKIEKLVLKGDSVNKEWVGKDAGKILNAIGISSRNDVRLIFTETDFDHPFVQEELLMPIIPLVKVKNIDEAIELSIKAEHDFRHTAIMHSKNIENMDKMAKAMNCSIFVKNAPSYAGLGLGGEGYTSFTIASPTGEGLTTVRDFTRVRRCTLAEYFRIV